MRNLAGTSKKCTYFSSRVTWTKRLYFVGRQMLRFLGPELLPKISSKKEGCNFWLISEWFVRYLAGL